MPQGFAAQLQHWLTDTQALQLMLGVAVLALLALWLIAGRRQRGLTALRDRAQSDAAQLEDLRGKLSRSEELGRTHELCAGQAQTRLDDQGQRLAEVLGERDELVDALHQLRQQAARTQTELAEARLAAEKDRQAAEREIVTLRELREEMTGQFKILAAETLRTQGADMQKVQSEQLQALLNPFREQVHRFQTELQSRNKVLDEEGARLREQITFLHTRSEEISREAVNLTRALKGEKQKQGAWGEMILSRILEDSGLEPGLHYEMQPVWRDEDNQLWRPDVVVRMPREKNLVIDSKVSLNDFETLVNASESPIAETALRSHVSAIRRHVITLAEKGYQHLDQGSVDYVLMFIPIEGALSEALRADPGLASFAMERGVGLTTPTTLMLTLRTVEHIWAVERRESNALAIAQRAGQLYDKFTGFLESMEGVGKALEQASRAHDQAFDRLARGPGNVIRQVEKLRELGARSQKLIKVDHDRGDDGDEGPDAVQIPGEAN